MHILLCHSEATEQVLLQWIYMSAKEEQIWQVGICRNLLYLNVKNTTKRTISAYHVMRCVSASYHASIANNVISIDDLFK